MRRPYIAFCSPQPLAVLKSRRYQPVCKPPKWSGTLQAAARPRIVLLPGMDGTASLLIDRFARQICRGSAGAMAMDATRMVLVDYPRDRHLSCSALAEFVAEWYLLPLADDERGYVVVAQSFSGHVALYLSSCRAGNRKRLPGHKGTVFVNCFCSLPTRWAKPFMGAIPETVFARQPPAWVTTRFFFGRGGTPTQMRAVQDVVAPVLPSVMKARIDAIANEDTWYLWRDLLLLPEALYIYGSADVLVGATKHVGLLRESRRDVEFVGVVDAGHLVLQTHGEMCARLIEGFVSRC
jgi:Alpha/beta hydrolase family